VAQAKAMQPAFDVGLETDLFPEAAIRFVEDHGLADRLYNDMEVGSYLLWRWRGQHPVFQDPRINGYPAAFHAVLRQADLDRPTWQAFLDRYGVRAALVSYPTQNPRAPRFDPALWALLYRDSHALVFARRQPARHALIAALELPLEFARGADGEIAARPLDAPPAASPVPMCEWQRRLGQHQTDPARAEACYVRALVPGCLQGDARAQARRALAALMLRRGAASEALAALGDLADRAALTTRGYALLHLHRGPEALAAFDRALAAPSAAADTVADASFGRALALEATGDRAAMIRALRAFLDRYPHHLAASAAAARLRREGYP
jgi:tetratricopeptide (TPR) repeat protein